MNRFIILPLNKLALSTTLSNINSDVEIDQSGLGEIGVLQQSFANVTAGVKHGNFAVLSASEQRLLYALSGSRDGVWDWNIEQDSVYYSERWKELIGHKKEEIQDSIEEWESRIHPDDLFLVLKDLQQHFSGKTSFFESTHRIRCQ